MAFADEARPYQKRFSVDSYSRDWKSLRFSDDLEYLYYADAQVQAEWLALIIRVAGNIFTAAAYELNRDYPRVSQSYPAMAKFKVAMHTYWSGQ